MKTSVRVVIAVIGTIGLAATLIGSFNNGKPASANAAMAPTQAQATVTGNHGEEPVWVYQPQVGMQAGEALYPRHYLLFTSHACDPKWLDNRGSHGKNAVYIMDSTQKPDFTNPQLAGCWYSDEVPAQGGQIKPMKVVVYRFILTPSTKPEGFDTENLIASGQEKVMADTLVWTTKQQNTQNAAKYVQDCAPLLAYGECPAMRNESDLQSMKVKLGFSAPTPSTVPPAAAEKSAVVASTDPADDPQVEACVSEQVEAYRKDAGDEGMVPGSMQEEWEAECIKQLAK